MKKILVFILAISVFTACKKDYQPRSLDTVKLKIDKVPFNIRAVNVTDKVTYFTTSKGRTVGFINGTDNFFDSSEKYYDSIQPNIRATAVAGNSFFTLNVGSPARVFKSHINEDGSISNPKIVYTENHKKAFYDSMAFFDEKNGIAIGDPTDECMSVLLTFDSGTTWCKVACDELPKAVKGEAAFAASNTNIAIVGDNAWIATGGATSRIIHSADKGKTWKVYNTPMIEGKSTTGTYTVDFYDENIGFIAGGDYTDKKGNFGNKALTTDGGKTWKLVAEGATPGYISCVQFVPNTEGKELFAVSTEGIYFSNNSGTSWKQLSTDGYYTIRFVDENTAWLAGDKKIAQMTLKPVEN